MEPEAPNAPRTVSGSSASRYQYEKTKFQLWMPQGWPESTELLKKCTISISYRLPIISVSGKPLPVTGDGKPYRRAPLTVSGKRYL